MTDDGRPGKRLLPLLLLRSSLLLLLRRRRHRPPLLSSLLLLTRSALTIPDHGRIEPRTARPTMLPPRCRTRSRRLTSERRVRRGRLLLLLRHAGVALRLLLLLGRIRLRTGRLLRLRWWWWRTRLTRMLLLARMLLLLLLLRSARMPMRPRRRRGSAHHPDPVRLLLMLDLRVPVRTRRPGWGEGRRGRCEGVAIRPAAVDPAARRGHHADDVHGHVHVHPGHERPPSTTARTRTRAGLDVHVLLLLHGGRSEAHLLLPLGEQGPLLPLGELGLRIDRQNEEIGK